MALAAKGHSPVNTPFYNVNKQEPKITFCHLQRVIVLKNPIQPKWFLI